MQPNNNQPNYSYQPQYPSSQPASANGMGIAGFVLSLIAICFSWSFIPGGILWLLGFIFSSIGMSHRPRGLAIAGFVISIVSLITVIVIIIIMGIAIGTMLWLR